ncbi:uncharacterized protein [Taeniopygia guttata]|uniref:uncharacterized protein n=1 Tax=Taeniopygia guttata TaxID=59729 RepID=UPI003BB8B286
MACLSPPPFYSEPSLRRGGIRPPRVGAASSPPRRQRAKPQLLQRFSPAAEREEEGGGWSCDSDFAPRGAGRHRPARHRESKQAAGSGGAGCEGGLQQAAKCPGSGAIREAQHGAAAGERRESSGRPWPPTRVSSAGHRSAPPTPPGEAGPAAHPGRLTFLFGIMSLLRAAKVKRPKEAPAEARDPPGGGGGSGGDTGVAWCPQLCPRPVPAAPPPAPRQPPPPAPASPTGRAERGGRGSRLAPPAAPRPPPRRQPLIAGPGFSIRRREGEPGGGLGASGNLRAVSGEQRTASARKSLQWSLYR